MYFPFNVVSTWTIFRDRRLTFKTIGQAHPQCFYSRILYCQFLSLIWERTKLNKKRPSSADIKKFHWHFCWPNCIPKILTKTYFFCCYLLLRIKCIMDLFRSIKCITTTCTTFDGTMHTWLITSRTSICDQQSFWLSWLIIYFLLTEWYFLHLGNIPKIN